MSSAQRTKNPTENNMNRGSMKEIGRISRILMRR